MQLLTDYHHYKKEHIKSSDRVAIYERYIFDMIFNSDLPDSQRDSSIAFELKHQHSTLQFARLLAKKRDLSEDVCCIGALLHDVHVSVNGSYSEHAQKSADMSSDILDKLKLFSEDEKALIIKIIKNHSDKDIWSDNPYEEFGKDVDILDAFLYPNAYGYYLKHKKIQIFRHYIKRAKMIWNELNIPFPLCFSALDNYSTPWLDFIIIFELNTALKLLSLLQYFAKIATNELVVPTFCFKKEEEGGKFFFNKSSFLEFSKAVKMRYGLELENFSLESLKGFKNENLCTHTMFADLSKSKLVVVWSSLRSYEILECTSPRIADFGINF
jgi:hypothetical protein